MPLFITYASYSQQGIKGMLENPQDRSEAVKKLVAALGGTFVAAYMTTGEHDAVIISETNDGADAVAAGMAAAATGAFTKVTTVRAWTTAEFVDVAKKAGQLIGVYSPPGR